MNTTSCRRARSTQHDSSSAARSRVRMPRALPPPRSGLNAAVKKMLNQATDDLNKKWRFLKTSPTGGKVPGAGL